MGAVVGVLVVAALIGLVVWNKKTAGEAMAGVEFGRPESQPEVAAAVQAALCGGMKGTFSGVKVRPGAGGVFLAETKLGDQGRIEVRPGAMTGAIVKAETVSLYVGNPMKQPRGGFMAIGWAITHGIYRLIGVTPYAAKMKRFQKGIEGRVAKQFRKASK